MSADDYINDAQQRILRLVVLLGGHEVTGLNAGEIAKALACSASVVTRDTRNLEHAGLAEKVPETDRWRLSPVVVQISVQHAAGLDRAQRRLDEIRNRYSRS